MTGVAGKALWSVPQDRDREMERALRRMRPSSHGPYARANHRESDARNRKFRALPATGCHTEEAWTPPFEDRAAGFASPFRPTARPSPCSHDVGRNTRLRAAH